MPPTTSERAIGPRPTIGIAGVWTDPELPHVNRGVPHNIASALRRLGVYSGYREAFPLTSAKVVGLWRKARHRPTDLPSLMLSPEMRVLSTVVHGWQRITTPSSVDYWLLFGGARSVRSRYATVTDESPHQFFHRSPAPSATVLYPHASAHQLRNVERRAEEVYRRATVCCVASHWAADSLVSECGVAPERVKVVGFGPGGGHDPSTVPLELRDWTRPSFLFVGNAWEVKNGDAVVRAFRAVRQRAPEAVLHLVGNHPSLSEDGVVAHGSLSRHEPSQRRLLDELFARATCFVMPSRVEPFGHVYVEAGTVGVASIGTIRGGATDAIGSGGLLVDPDDDRSIVLAMLRFCDADFAQTKGRVALEHAKLLTWDLVTGRILRALGISIPDVALAEFLDSDPRTPGGKDSFRN